VGYWVKDGARRRGVATRALELVSRWAIHELGVERLWLTTAPENAASQRVAVKAGFSREALLRAHVRFGNGRRDSVLYSLLATDPAG
jgi:RimJ/RimL family protein N-acetyltransferase